MKRLKKLSSFLMTVLLAAGCLFGALPVSAAGLGTSGEPFEGAGDLEDSYDGSITIHKFNISAWEREMNDPESDKRPQGAEDGYEITYNGLKASGEELQPGDRVGYYYLNQNDQSQDANRQYVTLADMLGLSNITFRLRSVQPKTGQEGSNLVQDYDVIAGIDSYGKTVNGLMKWAGVPEGYYLLEELDHDLVTRKMPAAIISMPMAGEDTNIGDPGTAIKDIHIYPKNYTDGPTIEKEIQTPADVNGNRISWQIRVKIPTDVADAQSLVVKDKMSAGLDFDENSFKVYIGGTDPLVELEEDTHYTLSIELRNPQTVTETNVTITFTPAGLALLGNYEGEKIHIDYETVINMTQDEWDNLEKIQNEAQLDFTNGDGHEMTTKPPVVTTDEYAGLSITKTDAVTDALLEGAIFAIYTEIDNQGNPITPLLDAAGNAVTITTGADGLAKYLGLGAGIYYLTEEEAPSGYKKLTGYIEITITDQHVVAQTIVNANVKNYYDSSVTLPETGGLGTFWFTVIGLALVIVSGVLYLIYRRRQRLNQ